MKDLRLLGLGLITALLGTALLAAAQDDNPKAKKEAPKAPPKKPASTTRPDLTDVVYGTRLRQEQAEGKRAMKGKSGGERG